jgi:hypothetical protein
MAAYGFSGIDRARRDKAAAGPEERRDGEMIEMQQPANE